MTAEDLLTRTFAEVTEGTEYPMTHLAEVVARSQAVRRHRRRRVALVAAAALVLTGGVSAGLALTGNDHDGPPAPAGPLGKLPTGPAPRIDYLDGDTFVTTSGSRFTSKALRKTREAVAWRNGVLFTGRTTTRFRYPQISFLTESGAPAELGCGTPDFAVPADGGDPVYWLSSGCDPSGGGSLVQGSIRTATPKGVLLTPVGQVSGGVVAAATGTTLHIPSHVLVLPPPGGGSWIPLHLLVPRGVSEAADLVSGQARNVVNGAVVDATSGEVKWRARYWSLSGFSPSGRYVVGSQSVGRQTVPGVGDVVGIFDAETGHQVLRKELPGLTIDTLPVFESDGAVLFTAEDHEGREALVRVGLGGTVTRTTHVVQGVPRPVEGRPPVPVLRPAVTP